MKVWKVHNRAAMVYAGILLLILSAGGCGYRFSPAGEKLGQEIKRVYVDVFTNNTPEANIEAGFRNAFIDQFIQGRRFKIVSSEGDADAVLKGDIRNLVLSPLAYRGAGNLTVEKRITVTLALTLRAKGVPDTLWKEDNFIQWGDFAADFRDLNAAQAGQRDALSTLAKDAAERAYRMMISDF